MSKRKTTEDFVQQAKAVHGDKYDYSQVIYKRLDEVVSIICPKHGAFLQRPDVHIHGGGCQKCYQERRTEVPLDATKYFIERARQKHKDKYDYSLVEYINMKKPVSIFCRKHGVFRQIPDNHLKGCGCPKCAGKNKSTQDFIQVYKNIH